MQIEAVLFFEMTPVSYTHLPNNLKLLTALLVIIALSIPVARDYAGEKKRMRANIKKYEEDEANAGA